MELVLLLKLIAVEGCRIVTKSKSAPINVKKHASIQNALVLLVPLLNHVVMKKLMIITFPSASTCNQTLKTVVRVGRHVVREKFAKMESAFAT